MLAFLYKVSDRLMISVRVRDFLC